jgi:DNA-directed RNA polymerase specialized sigma24 family protein
MSDDQGTIAGGPAPSGGTGGERDHQGSVERLIDRLKGGDNRALAPLWERYFEKLVKVARGRLPVGSPARVEGGSMDAALNALQSFQSRLRNGEYGWVTSRGDLWKLLVTMTRNKASNQAQRAGADKRHPRSGLVRESEMTSSEGERYSLEEVLIEEPTPAMAIELAERIERIHKALDDPELSRVFQLRLEGYSREEISETIDRAVRSVSRKLEIVRQAVEKEFWDDD